MCAGSIQGVARTGTGQMRMYTSHLFSMRSGVISVLQVLFATDVLAEAQAAAAAGWRAVLVSRPGNKALPEQPGFRVIENMQQLLTPFTKLLN